MPESVLIMRGMIFDNNLHTQQTHDLWKKEEYPHDYYQEVEEEEDIAYCQQRLLYHKKSIVLHSPVSILQIVVEEGRLVFGRHTLIVVVTPFFSFSFTTHFGGVLAVAKFTHGCAMMLAIVTRIIDQHKRQQ